MKKLLFGVFAVLAMIACNRDEVVDVQQSSFITFGDSFVEVKTRAAEDPSTTTASISAFDVWGFIGQPSGTVFNKERVTKGENGWSYQNLQYWTPEDKFYFHAVSPVDDSNIVVDTKEMSTEGLGNIAFTNAYGTTDLLYATLPIETGNVFPYYDDKVTLKFMHLLSKIKFTFKNGFTNENTSLAVKNIKIVDAPAEGNIDVNKSRLDFVWNLTQGKTTELVFGDVNGGKPMPLYSAEKVENGVFDPECAVERLTIPADATRSYTIEFDLELYYGDQLGMESHKTIRLENQPFEIGKNYNLVATINAENFADEALKAIEFEVEVNEWVEGEFSGYFDWDNNQPQEPEPAQTYKLYLNNEDAWSKVNVYGWDADGATIFGEWPGTEVTAKESIDGVEYFAYEVSAELIGKTINVIFNNGEGKQTADLTGVEITKDNFFTNYVEPVKPSETILYLQPNDNWKQSNARFAAYFFGNGETWVDMTLVEGETDIYAVTVPAGFNDIIFVRMNPSATANNWNNKWNQTADLKVPTDGNNLYTIKDGTWDKGGGTWSVYTPATVEPEPEQPEVVEPTYTTVAEFLAAEEDDTIYTLNGTITSVTQTTYGNFYLMDDTGEVLIYGLCSPEGAAQYWAASGAKVGDDITVKTVRTSYGGSPQGKNAIFVELVSPGTRAFWSFDATAVSFAATADTKTINVSLYNAKDEVKVASDNPHFTAEYADGKLTISVAENTTPDKIEGIVTISCGTLSQEISVSQNGASTGDKEEVTSTLTFDDKAKRTAFSTSSQTWTENGVTFVNEKNKSTNNVADYAKPVRCYQGSKVTVSVEGEISTIVFDCNSSSYATALKNSIKSGEVSVSSDKVTVKLNGEASFTVDQLSAQVRIDAVTVTYMK